MFWQNDPNSVNVPLPTWHTIWNGALTLLGGTLLWFAKEAKKVIDSKADKAAIEEKLDALDDTIKTLALKLDQAHEANTQRIDALLHTLIGKQE